MPLQQQPPQASAASRVSYTQLSHADSPSMPYLAGMPFPTRHMMSEPPRRTACWLAQFQCDWPAMYENVFQVSLGS